MRHAKRYIKPRVALMGDAAHTLHPLAGQGVNLGFADARCLANKMIEASQTNSDISAPRLLRAYERTRKLHNGGMIGVVEGFKRLFSNDSIRLSMLRNYGLKTVDDCQGLKKMILRYAMGGIQP